MESKNSTYNIQDSSLERVVFENGKFTSGELDHEQSNKRFESLLEEENKQLYSRISKFLIDKINKDLNKEYRASFKIVADCFHLNILNLEVNLSYVHNMVIYTDLIQYFNCIEGSSLAKQTDAYFIIRYNKEYIEELKEDEMFKNFCKSQTGIEKFDL